MTADAAMEAVTPSPSAVWGAEPEVLARELCQAVLSGIADASNAAVESSAEANQGRHREELDSFFKNAEPRLTAALENLMGFFQRNLLSIPDGLHMSELEHAVATTKDDTMDAAGERLDTEIASAREAIRRCDLEMRELSTLQRSAAQQASLMKDLHQTVDEGVRDGIESSLTDLLQDIVAAEDEYASTANILKTRGIEKADEMMDPWIMAASNVMSKARAMPFGIGAEFMGQKQGGSHAVDDEHAPHNHFLPSAQNILQISMGAEKEKLKDLSALSARLLG